MAELGRDQVLESQDRADRVALAAAATEPCGVRVAGDARRRPER